MADLSREEWVQVFGQAEQQGNNQLADFAYSKLKEDAGIMDFPAVVGAFYDVTGDSFGQLADATLSLDEAINLGLKGEMLPGMKVAQVEKQRVLQDMANRGYLPNTKIGGYTIEELLDSATGTGPSLAFTGLGVASAFAGPVGWAAGGSTIAAGVYNMSVNNSVNELARILSKTDLSPEKQREAIDSVVNELRLQGAIEAGTEFTGGVGLGLIFKSGLKKVLGAEASSIIKKGAKALGIGTLGLAGYITEETAEEVASGLAAGEIRQDVEQELGLKAGEFGGRDASFEAATDIAKQTLPGVIAGGTIAVPVTAGTYYAASHGDKSLANKPLISDKGKVTKTLDLVSDTFAKKSVSVLNPYVELNGEGSYSAQLRDIMEHREYGDAPGVVKQRDFFETKLNELGDLYNGVENQMSRLRDSFTGRKLSKNTRARLNSFINNPPKLSSEISTAVNEAAAGNYEKLNQLKGDSRKIAETAATANEIKNTVAEIESRLKDLGIEVAFSKTKAGLPLFFKTSAIRNNKDAFNNWLIGNGYAVSPVHAVEITENILSSGGVPYLQEPVRHRSYRKADTGETPGVVTKKIDPATVPQEFINDNLEQALPNYALKAATRIAHAKTFGAKGEKLKELVQGMINETRKKGQTVRDNDIKKIYDIHDALLGRFNQIKTEGVAQANKAATVFQAASTLGGATLSSIQEPLVIIERIGLMPTLQSLPYALNQATRGIIRTFNRKFAKQHDIMKVAEELGIAQEYANAEILTQTFSAEHASLLDTFFKSPFGFFLYQWTRWVRSWAAGAGMIKMDQYQREVSSGKLSSLSSSQLADLGISTKDMQAMVQAFNNAGVKFSDVLRQNATQPNVQSEQLMNTVLPSGHTARELLRTGVLRMVNDTVMAPRATVRPMWLNDPHFALLGELKSFPIVYGNTVIKRMVRKINPKYMQCAGGSLGPAMGALTTSLAMVGAAYAMQSVKYGLWGGEDPENRRELRNVETLGEAAQTRVGQAVQTAGILGPMQMLLDEYDYGPGGILGPTINNIADGWKEIQKLGEDKIFAGDFMASMGERTAKALGAFGKNKEVQEAAGNFFYNLVE